jgi:choline-glycine betaine transporter
MYEQQKRLYLLDRLAGWDSSSHVGGRGYYVSLVSVILFLVIGLVFTRFGSIRLCKDTDQPEFSNFSWFSMLFGAGIGIGILFWSVAEPISYFQGNPFIAENQQLWGWARSK